MEKTLIIIKPDAFMKKVAGKVISLFEEKGFIMLGARLLKINKDRAGEFYREHEGKHFYGPLVDFMSSNPSLVMVWGGENVIKKSREIIGNTDPQKAREATIRGRWASDGRHNIVHGSDSSESAKREIEFFFPSGEGVYSREEKEYTI
ncbi:MAG: nucleoside-diphosphate kinase [Elusimicrobiota bacterium]